MYFVITTSWGGGSGTNNTVSVLQTRCLAWEVTLLTYERKPSKWQVWYLSRRFGMEGSAGGWRMQGV